MACGAPIARSWPTAVSSMPPRAKPAATTAMRIAAVWRVSHRGRRSMLRTPRAPREASAGRVEASILGGASTAGVPEASASEAVGGLRIVRPAAPMPATSAQAMMVRRVPQVVAAMMATVGPIM